MFSSFIKLVRLPNLIFVVAIQYIMRWCIINSIIGANGFELQFGGFNFALLVLATVLLTASGYIINDYFDTESDLFNNPERVTIGKTITRKMAMNFHIALNLIAVVISFYISFKIGIYKIGFIFIIISGLLWFYSSSYKRQFLIGNLIVALLAGLVPFMVALFEIPSLNREYAEILIQRNTNFNIAIYWILGFSFFSFITTFFREIIKDIEDFEGDKTFGSNTMPIIIGVFYSKIVAIFLIILTIITLFYVQFIYIENANSFIYIIVAIILPLLFLIYKLIIAKTKEHFHFASILSKIIMILGVLYSIVACYNFSNYL